MSASLAILCSGQGTQHAGMFDLVTQSPAAEAILAAAGQALGGVEPARFVRDADAASLFSNRNGQVLCCTQALAAWAVVRPHLPGQLVLAGYSVGELAAWGCAGLLAPTEIFRLASVRAGLMDEAAGDDTGLAALRGLRRGLVEAFCHSQETEIAIVNDEDFFIVGGKKNALRAVCDAALQAGAITARLLPVAVAAHTSLLAEASRDFGEALAQIAWPDRVPDSVRLLSGVDGDAVFDVSDGARKLAAQISQPLDWAACLESCRAAGVTAALELGPGNALARMANRILPGAQCRSVDDFRSPDGLLNWLGKLG
ncbi:MAG: acyltransferase domain-containing protein [Verrucomicrobia bacterium]|nr:acyltransferase domain-containing protein [Verrucomicrobiota bacterium]